MRSIPIDAALYIDAVTPEELTEVMVTNRRSLIQSVVASSLIAFAIRDNAPGTEILIRNYHVAAHN